MTTKRATMKRPSRLMAELLETAEGMRASGVMDESTYRKITMRDVPVGIVAEPMSGDEVRTLREHANLSQAVFAKYLNLSVGYVSQLERGTKQPSGPALVLLNVIRRKGLEAIL